MTRTLSILIALLVLLGSFLVIRYAKDSYKILPIDEKNPLTDASSNFLNWREFRSPEGTFKVLLPSLPQHVADKVADPITREPRKFDMYATADENGTVYMISTTSFPNKVGDKNVEEVLRSVVNDMLERNKENKLKSAKLGSFRKSQSLDFALENADVTVAGKAFLQGNTMYVLSMLDKTASFKTAEFDFFVNSFDFDKVNEKAPPSEQKSQKVY